MAAGSLLTGRHLDKQPYSPARLVAFECQLVACGTLSPLGLWKFFLSSGTRIMQIKYLGRNFFSICPKPLVPNHNLVENASYLGLGKLFFCIGPNRLSVTRIRKQANAHLHYASLHLSRGCRISYSKRTNRNLSPENKRSPSQSEGPTLSNYKITSYNNFLRKQPHLRHQPQP